MTPYTEYHQPDPVWDILGCKSYTDYANKFVVKGAFNHSVPEDIRNAYATIEYLMAHAYYHFKMYDEALAKMLVTLEMAIRIKSQLEGISLTQRDATRVKDKSAYQLLQELKLKETHPELYKRILLLKVIRNDKVHPNKHTFMGGASVQVFPAFITYVNTLFPD